MGFSKLGCILFLEAFTVEIREQSTLQYFLVGQILEGTDQSWMFSAFLAERWEEGSSSNFGGDLPLHRADGARTRRHSLASGAATCSGRDH